MEKFSANSAELKLPEKGNSVSQSFSFPISSSADVDNRLIDKV